MSSAPIRLLSLIVFRGTSTFRQIVRGGMRSDWLMEPEFQNAWHFMADHFSRYGSTPSRAHLAETMPHLPLLTYEEVKDEVPGALISQLKETFIQARMYEIMDKALAMNDSSPSAAAQYVVNQTQQLTALTTNLEYIDISSSADEVEEEYNSSGVSKLIGLPYPWESVRHRLMAMLPEQLIVIYGRPKSMKTFMALYMVTYAYLYHGARVLIVTREISKEQMRKRIVALMARIAYGPWRRAALEPWQRDMVFELLRGLAQYEESQSSLMSPGLSPGIRIVSGNSREYKGLDLVAALIDDFQPDIVLDDGFYLAAMGGDGRRNALDWQVQSELSKKAKVLAAQNHIIYMLTTQANRSTLRADILEKITSADDMAITEGPAQDCDVAFRPIRMRGDPRRQIPNYLILSIPISRDSDIDALAINAQPCVNFDEIPVEQLKQWGVDEKIVTLIMRDDYIKNAIPAGPTTSCDDLETEISTRMTPSPEYGADAIPDIPGTAPTRKPTKKVKRRAPKRS